MMMLSFDDFPGGSDGKESACNVGAAAAKSLQPCLTLCNPIDGSPPGSCVPGILQARTLEWVAISFSNASKWKVKVMSLSPVWLLAIPWTAAHQDPPSMGFSRQECWSGVPLPSPSWQADTSSKVCWVSSLVAYSPWGCRVEDDWANKRKHPWTQNFYVLFLRDDYGFSEAFLLAPE